MSRKYAVPGMLATALIAVSLSTTGCSKKEEAAPEAPAATATAPQTAAAPAAPEAPASQAAPPASVPAGGNEYLFEDGVAGWTGTDKTVKVEPASKQKHGGKGSLKVSGTAGNGKWSFAVSPRMNLEPGKKYQLTGWLYVEAWDKADLPPLIKCGVYTDNKWTSNAFSSKYDLSKKQWQQVKATFVAPPKGTVMGAVSLEKGTQDPVTATIYLDDIKLERVK